MKSYLHDVVRMPYDGYFSEGIDTLSDAAPSAHEGADEINEFPQPSAHEGADEIRN